MLIDGPEIKPTPSQQGDAECTNMPRPMRLRWRPPVADLIRAWLDTFNRPPCAVQPENRSGGSPEACIGDRGRELAPGSRVERDRIAPHYAARSILVRWPKLHGNERVGRATA